MTQVWVNGVLATKIDPMDRGLAYGDGLFATMRIVKGEVQFLPAHFARLTQGAKRLGFAWSASPTLAEQLKQLALTQRNACVKLLLSRGVGGRGYAAPSPCLVNEVVFLSAFPQHYCLWQREGISLALSDILLAKQPRLAGIKHLNRLEQVLIKSIQLPEGFDDWLVLDNDGSIIESSIANLFFIKERTIFTPAITHCGVAGMMREQVIYALIDLGYNLDIKPIHHNDLAQFEHCFMTNSLLGLVDIKQIDSIAYSKSSFSDTLRQTLHLSL
ncbi:aminodeoxychorismate lyase [Shewanella sp. D64]|uniref:aminodeoxychorismate lyase n=1 Tax=unclassified Shewanella TaxID=196818 RepID=UPI0022BA38C2|nr:MULTISPECIES: aminodeoxychorismate lyase [unclassified Shewanella]MEC4724851.1 aminodeoxychorismate lyase [Shewanella sp. D64]MEC4736355.1 aminodeoxychorismate lyase [Shewanella sp. E94]WBJ97585.1 aminodeoxychorismate lyase [Shewanella sp. MTB7]